MSITNLSKYSFKLFVDHSLFLELVSLCEYVCVRESLVVLTKLFVS